MKLTAAQASTLIWICAASLFVVLAIFAGHAIFFRHGPSERQRACQQAQARGAASSSQELSIADAVCTGVSQ